MYMCVDFTHFSCCFNAYLFRKHMLSVLHYPATFPLSSSSFVRSFISENVDNHCTLILIKLIDSTCNSSSCIITVIMASCAVISYDAARMNMGGVWKKGLRDLFFVNDEPYARREMIFELLAGQSGMMIFSSR